MRPAPKLELITLGDELLLGIRQNGHLAWLGEQFARHGLTIQRNTTLRDEASEIARVFPSIWAEADIVLTTGGLGPTSDDNTREAIAEALGLELEFEPAAEQAIRERFERMGRQVSTIDRKQCFKPAGARILPNGHGTAPGILLEQGSKVLIMLPGPTQELHPMFLEQVLPWLVKKGALQQEEAFVQLRVCGTGESLVNEALQPLTEKYPGLGIAFCVHEGVIDVRLSSEDKRYDADTIDDIAHESAEILGEDFVCFGHSTLAKVVFDELRAMEKTLAVAESCTGGLLSNAFTDIPGASKVFSGGVVCYKNEAKVELLGVPEAIIEQHGAVSAETAVAMAMGVAEKLDTDYAMSVTGFAGPGGGTAEAPVGTIFIGYYAPCGVWSRKFVYPGERLAVKARAVNYALDWARRKLRKYKMEDMLATMGDAAEAPHGDS
ncbi:MAG: competence/damage-inducible protein A [Opitutales bacterium]